MSSGYEIVSTTFVVGPDDPEAFVAYGTHYHAKVTATAPTGKRWVCLAAEVEPGSAYGYATPYVIASDGVALNSDGTEFTRIFLLDTDGNGQPVETTKIVRAIAVDA